MKIITEELDFNIDSFRSLDFYIPNGPYAVLDLETTSLSPAYGSVILSGLIKIDGNIKTLTQFFATSLMDEEELLANTVSALSDCKYIITYNGRMFDIPFLEKRCKKYNIELPWVFNLDLFLLFKHYSDLPKFISKFSQKSLEEYAGISGLREDRISGGESVDLFSNYLDTGSKDLERRILLHNSDDVKQLLRLTSLLRNVDVHKSLYKSGFPVLSGRITNINLKKEDLIITGFSDTPMEYVAFPSPERPFHFLMSGKDGSFAITVNGNSENNNTYVDLAFLGEFEEALSFFPAYVNKYAILKENGLLNHLMINMTAKYITEYILTSL